MNVRNENRTHDLRGEMRLLWRLRHRSPNNKNDYKEYNW
jgi:hypothetical protein